MLLKPFQQSVKMLLPSIVGAQEPTLTNMLFVSDLVEHNYSGS